MISPPTTWAGRIGSPRNTNARTTAIGGTNDWSVMTRVGPRSITPLNTITLAMAAASTPEYTIASTIGTACVGQLGTEHARRQQLRDTRPG